MNRSLYFIPMIEKALGQTDPKKALVEAFRKIKTLGNEPEYEEGFAMFTSFMAEVIENWEIQNRLTAENAADIIENITLQLASETLSMPSDDLKRVEWPPGLVEELERRLRTLPIIDDDEPELELDIIRDRVTVETIRLYPEKSHQSIGDIRPGQYTFSLGSGRVLWEVALREKDLLISSAEPGSNLRLAADTGGEKKARPSREMAVMNGELVFRVFPGLENGRIEIETRMPK